MPLTRRQIYRRRRLVVFGGALLILATAFYLPITLLAPLQLVEATIEVYEAPPVAEQSVTFPDYGAAGVGAIGYPGVLASAGSTDPLPIASIAKIVTALVVLDAKPLDLGAPGPDLTFGAVDEQFYSDQVADGGSVASVYSGQVISQLDVMRVMLLASANNYAESLAAWAFGSKTGYLDAARSWLGEQGLTGTNIVDPSGVDPANTSTVADLIELARNVQSEPVLAQLVGTASVEIPELGVIENRNALLGIDGIDGIKTGTLDEAGSCLLFSQDHAVGTQTVTIVGVVLGGPDHETIDAAIRALLTEVDAGFREVQLAAPGQAFADYSTPWGDSATAEAAGPLTAAVWGPSPVTLEVETDPVRLAEAGTDIGEAIFTVGDREVSVPLELSATIDDPGPWWRLTNPLALLTDADGSPSIPG
jgi:D-alanyl-D-alanine carboxypeptidase (penicillin-binding protein 5/6)